MTLTLATTPDLAPEARRLEGALHAHGVSAGTSHADVRMDEAPVLLTLRSGEASVALVRAETLLEVPDDLTAVAVLTRDDPRDVVIPSTDAALTLHALPAGARVCVTDARRRGFLRAYRPDVLPVRPENGEGPAGALRAGSVDAVILGNAEARRLALRRRASEVLDPKAWVPGAGQGTLLLVARADDRDAAAACAPVDDAMARAAWIAEAAVVSAQGVPEGAPMGVMALPHGRWIRVWGMAASEDGTRVVRGDVTGKADDPGSAGRALADLLTARGVAAVLRRVGP